MNTQERIQQLIIDRNKGDKTAQAKIDSLFASHRGETAKDRDARDLELKASNALVYSN